MTVTTADPAATYRQEAAELLAQLEETLLDLESSPDDQELIGKAFRALHTIKGSGSMFGFEAVAAFTHHVETAFESVRSGRFGVTPALISLTLSSLDHIRGLIDAPEDAARPEIEERGAALLAALADIVGGAASGAGSAPPALIPSPPGERKTWTVTFRLAENAMYCGTNPLLLLEELRALGECAVTALDDRLPGLDEMDPAGCYLGWKVVLTTDQPRTAIDDVFIFVADDAQIAVEEAVPLAVAAGKETPSAAPASPPVPSAPPARGESRPSVRVQAERLDSLMDQVGELVIAQARLTQIAAASDDLALRSIAEDVERLAADLRDTTMGIRMLQIGTLFGRFRRVVRDLSQALDKSVALITTGEETELDKTVIESLNDPLVHLIRNAVDHGIESPEERLAAGKPAEGRIVLSAEHAGAQVLITVSDDGKGMDRAAIRRKAEERGLIRPGADLSDSELFSFIFHPGFSTAGQVSNVSGRGVGMDVVRQAINSLRGSIEVASEAGAGSRITLKLPLTLAIIDGLLVRVGAGRYVLPLSAVEECVDLSPEDDAQGVTDETGGRSFLNLRGALVPFVRLRGIFDVPGRAEGYQKVVIVTSGGLRVGLVVDHVIGQYQTVIKSLNWLLDDVEHFSGATILGDGSVSLILDIPHLLKKAQAGHVVTQAS
ncbi:chemotaxis protein CheA [Telmatospirillum sp. J64-1]|uniref:chemotaxis protein CheA n=1 Tax=Telmatospirillum sp. J64-1 TaxID=2502183 RepID=UPI00115C5321|nr:chemotaxis protein CheA [Telmatospirillum sp. J64-1]